MKHTLAIKYEIGQKITASKIYPIKCSDRFPGHSKERVKDPVGFVSPSPFFVIGARRAIMADYKYSAGYSTQGFEDPYPEGVPPFATGKYEEVLIVVKSIDKPQQFIIRVEDILTGII